INVAAWGAFYYDPPKGLATLPQVTFRLYNGRQNSDLQAESVSIDIAYNQQRLGGPDPDLVIDTAAGDPVNVMPWVAKVRIPLGRGNAVNSQTPGNRYTIQVEARLTSVTNGQAYWCPLSLGQLDLQPF